MSEVGCDDFISHNAMLRKENDTLAKEIVKKDVTISQQNDAIAYLQETCNIYCSRFAQPPPPENIGASSPTGDGEAELVMPML
jgi:hypothetical protein